MKKALFYVTFIVFIVLVACSNDTGTTSQGKSESNNNELAAGEGSTVEDEENESSHEEEEETEAKYVVTENWSLEPIEEGVNEDVVLLTFDDSPDQHAVEMAKTLKKLDAKAIFFVNGHFLDTPEEEKMLKEIHEMGFSIGNHTYNHVTIPEVSEEVQKEEIVSLNDRVEEIIGERPVFFRAPHGANTDYSTQVAEEEGMTVMNWTYGYDYFEPYMDAEKLTTAMVTGEGPEVDVSYSLLKPGANLLMHDREWTKEALPGIVEGLRDKGYEMLDPALIKTN